MNHPPSILKHDFAAPLAGSVPPCISLYLPTHRHFPDNRQDVIRFGNLVKQIEDSLLRSHSPETAAELLRPFRQLAEDAEFWQHTRGGLAVLAAKGVFQVITTERPLPGLAIVADSFHTKPLWKQLQTSDRFQVLALSRETAALYEGSRDSLEPVSLADGVPATITEALGDQLTPQHRTVASYGGTGPGRNPMQHGHGAKADAVEQDTERFFRAVDQAIAAHHSKPSGLPLILAALPEYHTLFRSLSKNPLLAPEGIRINAETASPGELREKAWEIAQPVHRERLASLKSRFLAAQSQGLGSDDLSEVAAAAATGRVETLLVNADKQIPGRLNLERAWVEPGELNDPSVDDVLDDLGVLAAENGGDVWMLSGPDMPSDTGLAAIYRY